MPTRQQRALQYIARRRPVAPTPAEEDHDCTYVRGIYVREATMEEYIQATHQQWHRPHLELMPLGSY
jgi:hypothetical protein